MHTLSDPTHTVPGPAASGSAAMTVPARTTSSARWPLIGALAAAAGFGASALQISAVSDPDDVGSGLAVLDRLDRTSYHVSFVLGLVSIAALHLVAAGWKRWAADRAPNGIAARSIGAGFSATAIVNTVFACLAGSMALYLEGGTDEGMLADESLFVVYSLLDFGQLLGWWGAMLSAGCVAAVALRSRLLPRWLGVVSILFVLLALTPAVITGLPGIVGLVMPIWLIVTSFTMTIVGSRSIRPVV